MEGVNNDYLGKHKKFRLDSKKLAALFFISAFIVAIIVFWWLKLVGITVTGDTFCSVAEHSHSDECYISELVCGFDETSTNSSAVDETTAQLHAHSDGCYQKTLVCTKTEHTHSQACFSDKTADVETVSDWLKTLEDVEITNNIPENLIAVAMSQKGYEESQKNFEYDSDGDKKGYTRYGEWYGNPYGSWNAMFVSFCLHYAPINNAHELKADGAESLKIAWQNRGVYSPKSEHSPERGDIVFIDNDADKTADTVGIALSSDGKSLVVVMGDSNNKVETINISNTESIVGYGLTGELSFATDTEYRAEEKEPTTGTEETEHEAPPLMLFNSAPANTEEPNITYINDLTTVVKAVQFKTTEGEVIDNNSTVYIGQTYVVSMEFAEKNTGSEWIQFRHDEDHQLHYQIPSNIHCEPFTEWHPITAKTENGTIEDVGEYFINEDGMLIVVFEDDPVTGECFGAKYSNVDFTIDFNATVGSTQSGTSEEVVFNDEIKVTLDIDGGADMTFEKSQLEYDEDTHTVDFKIVVKATKGVVKDLVVDDVMWHNQFTLRDTILVTDLEGNVLNPQPTVSNSPEYNNGDEEGFRLSGFPDFSAGNGYIITYKTQIYDDILNNESVYLWNDAYANGNSSNGTKINKYSFGEGRIEFEKMEKNGKQSVLKDDNGNPVPVIEWNVEIKKDNHNLQGTVIIDTLGDGLSYYTGQAIRVKHFDEWGNELPDTYIDWQNVTINGNQMSFPLPEGHSFEITYYTEYEELQEGEKKNYTNSVSATINGKEETAGADADVVGFTPNVIKSARGDDGEYVYFTIEADIPGVIKNWGGFYLTDMSAFWNFYGPGQTLYVDNKPQDINITVTTETNQTITFKPYTEGGAIENTYILESPSEGNLYHSFKLYFNTETPTIESSKWLIAENSKITITYKIPFDSKTGTEWTGEPTGDLTIEDALLQNEKLANEVYFNYSENIQTTASSTYLYTPKITKKSSVNDNGTIDYTVTFYNSIPGTQGPEGYLTSSSSVVFTDTFDEKLEYVPGSLSLICYSPWNDSTWFNKYVYNGTVTGNTINVQSTDLVYTETNQTLDAGMLSWLRDWMPNYQTYCNNISGGRHVFTYSLRLKPEYLNTTEENKFLLDNTAELIWDNDNSSGPVSDTAEYKTGLIDKHAVQENNQLKFDIHINRNSLDILKGTDTLTIEDTMTANLSVYWDSIKLYYEDADGNWIDFDEADDDYSYTVTYDQASNKLTFVIPDELHIRIDYTTLITESGLISVNNAVKVDGKAQVSDIIDAVFKVDDHSGGASGSMHSITLLKQDGDTDIRLPDVGFLLYGPMGDPGAVLPDGVNRSITTESGTNLYYIGSYTTGSDGTVEIKTQYLTLGGPYALVEKSAPEGYIKLENPVYFYF